MKKIICLIFALFSLSVSAYAADFVHPGILTSREDFENIKTALSENDEVVQSGLETLLNSSYSSPDQTSRAVSEVIRGGTGDNVVRLYTDIAKAYQNALRWKITGNEACGKTAASILNSWSAQLKSIGGNADRYLASGLYGYQLAAASEIMREHEDFNTEQMQKMLLSVFYKPLCERFLYANSYGGDHNGAVITNYWANWDLCNMAATMAIGIFCDREDIFLKGVNYFKYGDGNGSLLHATPYAYADNLVQWQESGRDQAHAILGIGLTACCCEMAWNQGIDLYAWLDNRFMAAAEYCAKYNIGEDVPFTTYQWRNGTNAALQTQTQISSASRGQIRPIWEMIYNHYHNRMGFDVPNIEKMLAKSRPEGGGGGHASTFDQPGMGTLLYGAACVAPQKEASCAVSAPIEGMYALKNANSKKYLYSQDSSAVQGDESSLWEIRHLGNGVYTIKNSNGYLTVSDYSFDNYATAVTAPQSDSLNQRFALIPRGQGVQIIPLHSGKPLGVRGSSAENGAVINQFMNNFDDNQHWILEAQSSEPDFISSAKYVYCSDSDAYKRLALLSDGFCDSSPCLSADGIIVMDYGEEESLSVEEIKLYGKGSVSFSSDGKAWIVAALGENGKWTSTLTDPTPYRYIKIDGSGLCEMRLYGKRVGAANKSENLFFTESFDSHPLDKAVTSIGIAEFSLTPLCENINSVVGFTGDEISPSGWSDFSAAVRMNNDGYFDVRSGDEYVCLSKVYYEAGKTYAMRVEFDADNSLYNVFADDVCIAYGCDFRTDAPKIEAISKYCAVSAYGSANACISHISVRDGELSSDPNITASMDNFGVLSLSEAVYPFGTVDFDVTAFDITDGFMGFCSQDTSPVSWGSYPIIVRLRPDGFFDAINGDAYIVSETKYEPGVKYHIRIEVDVSAKKYSAFVTDESNNEYTVARDYSFRTSAAETKDISLFSPLAGSGCAKGLFSVSDIKASSPCKAQISFDGENAVITTTSEVSGILTLTRRGDDSALTSLPVSFSGELRIPLELSEGDIMLWEDFSTMKPLAKKLTVSCP